MRTKALAVAAMLLAATAVALHAGTAEAAPSGFVTRSGGGFVLNGQPFRYGGTNNYYPIFASQTMVDDLFDDAKAMALTVMRAWASLDIGSLDGSVPHVDGEGKKAGVYFQYWDTATGKPAYNDGADGLEHLDHVISKAAQSGVRLILPFVNNWKEFGGMDQYVKWAGGQYHDQFYTNATIKGWYKNWISHLLNRTNTVTGVTYKDDPTIFAWELANEPRCVNANLPASGTCATSTLTGWAGEMSAYIKSLDANHMVSVGDEGFLNQGNASDWLYNGADGVDHEALTSLPGVDFGTYHLYPDGWGRSADWGTQWIKDHQAAAQAYGKPVILEEFGITGSSRDTVYKTWTSTVRNGTGDGWNFWLLTGVDWDGVSLYPDYDGFRVYYPSATATVLADEARAIGGIASSPSPSASPSPSPSPSPSASPSPSGTVCVATYRTVGQWPGGFQGEVTVKNTGGPAITGWTVTWTFPNGQTITQLWGGRHTQSSADVTVTNESWNGGLSSGASATFGFLAGWSGTNATPTGVSCAAR